MTIASAYLVAEGLVLGTDSTTTVERRAGTEVEHQLLNHAQKLFEIGDRGTGRLALCTWGNAAVGEVAHRTIAARLGDRIDADDTVERAADRLVEIIEDERTRQGGDALGNFGYFFGGIQPVSHVPGCLELRFEKGELKSRIPFGVGQARFQGAPRYFGRVYMGFDPELPERLYNELEARAPGAVPPKIFVESFQAAASGLTLSGYANLPIRDAVDFLHMYLHVTVKAFKFRFGPPLCGGPLEIGFISTDRPFRWARHKPFDVAILEPEAGA